MKKAAADLCILLVDDDALSRRLAALLLKRLDVPSPDTATNGREAVEAVLVCRYDLVLMDVEMPELDGREALLEIRQRLGSEAPRIVALSAENHDDLRRLGFDDVIAKPLGLERLSRLIECAREDGTAAADDFNHAAWNELLRLFKSAGMAELVQVLVADVPEQQRRHAAAVDANDLPALGRIAHALRGSSLQLGAASLADACTQAEAAAKAGDQATATALMATVIARHAALVERLRAESRG